MEKMVIGEIKHEGHRVLLYPTSVNAITVTPVRPPNFYVSVSREQAAGLKNGDVIEYEILQCGLRILSQVL